MDLAGIISISGRPGLYKVIAQGKNNIIVESLIDKKRIPAYSSDRISALEDISIYTLESDKPIKDIFSDMFKKLEGKECLSHKSDIDDLQEYLLEILPDYDEDRVYSSDIKKIFQWYNMLLKYGVLEVESDSKEEQPKEDSAKTKVRPVEMVKLDEEPDRKPPKEGKKKEVKKKTPAKK